MDKLFLPKDKVFFLCNYDKDEGTIVSLYRSGNKEFAWIKVSTGLYKGLTISREMKDLSNE